MPSAQPRLIVLLVAVFLSLSIHVAAQDIIDIEVDDVATMPVPHHLTYSSELVIDGKIYYLGGLAQPSGIVIGYDELWALDLATGAFDELPFTLPYELTMAPHVAAAYVDDHLFLSPGFATGNSGGWGSHNRVIEVDLANETTSETLAFPSSILWGSSAIAANGKVYFFGGWNGGAQSWIFELDPQAGTFVQVASMLGASNDVVPTLGADGWIYYWGRLLPDIQRFDPVSQTVESTGVAMVTGGNGVHRAYVRWHFPADRKIYFTKPGNNAVPSSPLYVFDYDAGSLTATDVVVPMDLVNQRTVLDPDDPSTLYAFRTDSNLETHLQVARVRLIPDCSDDDFETEGLDDWTLTGIGSANQLAAEVVDDAGNSVLALTADGSTSYYGADNAGLLVQELVGDFRIETTVDASTMTTGKAWRKAGLMARADFDPWGVRLLAMLVPVQDRLQFVAREVAGAPGNIKVAEEVLGAPDAVRLAIERAGQVLTVSYSLDEGASWTTPATGLGGSIEILDLPETLYVGLAVVSNNISVTSTAHFDDVSICR